MPFMFQDIANQKIGQGIPNSDRIASARWYAQQASQIDKDSFDPEFHMLNAQSFQTLDHLNVNSIGKMYSFIYNPKTKDKLPYYDTFPVIFPIEFYPSTKSGPAMLGINLHYLSPWHRAKLMNALWGIVNNNKLNSTTKLKVSYGILKGFSQFDLVKPCIKKYLFDPSFMRSKFMVYNPKVWDYVVALPMAKFEKQSQETVWLESILKANK